MKPRQSLLARLVALALVALGASPGAAAEPDGRGEAKVGGAVPRLESGVVLPYPTQRLFRGFGRCIGRGRHRHEGIDLGGVGPDGGLGTPVRSMVRARVVMVGSGQVRPRDFGTPYRGRREVVRGGRRYRPSREVPGYGQVHFFTSRAGKWRSGNMVATVGLEPPLEGHLIRYMHLGAIRPGLGVGDVVEAGDELGLLGGTGVQRSSPHVHIDIRTAEDVAVDVAPLLGLAPTARCGDAAIRAEADAEHFEDHAPVGPPPPDGWAGDWPAGPAGDPRPPLTLLAPVPPWRRAGVGGVVTAEPIEVDLADCGAHVELAEGAREVRLSLHTGRFVELAVVSVAGGGGDVGLEVWDRASATRLPVGASSPVAVSEPLAKAGGPARLRLVAAAPTRLALVVRSAGPWRLELVERCKRRAP